jgi:predicted permease
MGAQRTSRRDSAIITFMVVGKLLVLPSVTFALLSCFDLDPLWAKVALVMAATPVGVNVYVFAQRYHRLVDHVAVAILISTIVSVSTLAIVLAM